MNILYIKALHIIFVVTWFAGLFYVVRLFIYHTEANEKPEPDRSILITHFKLAEKRLWYGITFPSMILTYIFGFWMAWSMFGSDFPHWLWMKLLFVFGLTIYHFICHNIFQKLQKDLVTSTSFKLRMWNEVATLFLFAIVFIVVLKDSGNWLWGMGALVLLAFALMIGIKVYKKIRERN